MKSLSHVRLFATPWTVAYQAPRSMGFSRQEYWSGVPFPSPGDLPNPGIEPGSPVLQTDALPSEPLGKPWEFSSVQSLRRVRLFATPWTVAHQAPLSMGFSRQEHWSGLPFTSPGDLPNPGFKPASLTSNLHWQTGSLPLSDTWEALRMAILEKRTLGKRDINKLNMYVHFHPKPVHTSKTGDNWP